MKGNRVIYLATAALCGIMAVLPVYGERQADTLETGRTWGMVQVHSHLNVRSGPGTGYDIIEELENGSICSIREIDSDWAYMEYEGTGGYVSMEYVRLLGSSGHSGMQEEQETQTEQETETGQAVETEQEAQEEQETQEEQEIQAEEEAPAEAKAPAEEEVQIEPERIEEENTEESTETVAGVDTLRQDMVNYALQFVGNPYVWGGTSLTDGADCSGFVQSIYANYGIGLPRTSGEQAYAGEQIPIEEALPGDLIFYADEEGTIYHVVLYMGDGQVVQAASTKAGIITSGINYEKAVWAERYF